MAGESPDTSERDRERAPSLGEGQSPGKTPKDPATVPLAAGVPAARAEKNGAAGSGPEPEAEPEAEAESAPDPEPEPAAEEGEERPDSDGPAASAEADDAEPPAPKAEAEAPKPLPKDNPTTTLRVGESDSATPATPPAPKAKAKPALPKDKPTTTLRASESAKPPTPAAADDAEPSAPKAEPEAPKPLPKDNPTTTLRTSESAKPATPPTPKAKAKPAAEAEAPPPKDQPTAMLRGSESAASAPPPMPTAPPPPPAAPNIPPPPRVPPPPADSERDPLELLAALTNRPAPPPTPWRNAVRRIKIYTPVVLLLLLVFGAAQALRPLPDPTLELTAADSFTFEGSAPAVPWPETGQAALGVDGVGSFGTSGGEEPVPIASVAKVMTAYVILRDHPLEPGATGPGIPIDQQAEDDAGMSEETAESTVDLQAGDTISEYEALQAIMIPSANNVARLLARWDAGSEEAFVDKMNEAAAELGMEDTTYTDPSGLRDDTVSTAADQVLLAEAAMQDPVFREVVGVSSYIDSYGVEHRNWNYLVPVDGVIGIKTGTTTAAGGCLLFAAEQEVNGENQLIIGAVLGQPPAPEDNSILTGALNAGDALIDFAQDTLVSAEVFASGDVVGEVDDGLGGGTPVRVAESVTAVGWPGLEVRVALGAAKDGVPHTADAGAGVGNLRVGNDDGGVSVPVELAAELGEPGLGARLRRLG